MKDYKDEKLVLLNILPREVRKLVFYYYVQSYDIQRMSEYNERDRNFASF
jgi:hypothetical protein